MLLVLIALHWGHHCQRGSLCGKTKKSSNLYPSIFTSSEAPKGILAKQAPAMSTNWRRPNWSAEKAIPTVADLEIDVSRDEKLFIVSRNMKPS